MLEKYKKIDSYESIPEKGIYIILTRSRSFLAKAIQGFMRLWQWMRGERDTKLVPNHADGLKDGYAIGAMAFGVDGDDIDSHFSHAAVFYVIKPIFTGEQEERFWYFLQEQEKERYAYLDLLKYALNSIFVGFQWRGEPLDRNKWTCFSLIASAVNYAYNKEVFPNPHRISPFEVCNIIDKKHGILFK